MTSAPATPDELGNTRPNAPSVRAGGSHPEVSRMREQPAIPAETQECRVVEFCCSHEFPPGRLALEGCDVVRLAVDKDLMRAEVVGKPARQSWIPQCPR